MSEYHFEALSAILYVESLFSRIMHEEEWRRFNFRPLMGKKSGPIVKVVLNNVKFYMSRNFLPFFWL